MKAKSSSFLHVKSFELGLRKRKPKVKERNFAITRQVSPSNNLFERSFNKGGQVSQKTNHGIKIYGNRMKNKKEVKDNNFDWKNVNDTYFQETNFEQLDKTMFGIYQRPIVCEENKSCEELRNTLISLSDLFKRGKDNEIKTLILGREHVTDDKLISNRGGFAYFKVHPVQILPEPEGYSRKKLHTVALSHDEKFKIESELKGKKLGVTKATKELTTPDGKPVIELSSSLELLKFIPLEEEEIKEMIERWQYYGELYSENSSLSQIVPNTLETRPNESKGMLTNYEISFLEFLRSKTNSEISLQWKILSKRIKNKDKYHFLIKFL